jgi:hypothetical protein
MAFETCWSAFPDRDIFIVHPDIAPVLGQDPWGWYRGIADYRKKLPDTGMIACNLLFQERMNLTGTSFNVRAEDSKTAKFATSGKSLIPRASTMSAKFLG